MPMVLLTPVLFHMQIRMKMRGNGRCWVEVVDEWELRDRPQLEWENRNWREIQEIEIIIVHTQMLPQT
jgi:hypothetical protein